MSLGKGKRPGSASAAAAIGAIALVLAVAVGASAEGANGESAPEPAQGGSAARQDGEPLRLRAAEAPRRKVFFDHRGRLRRAVYEFELAGRARDRRDVVVRAIWLGDGECRVKRRWRLRGVGGKQPRRIAWDGRITHNRNGGDRAWSRQGRHVFRVFDARTGEPADLSRTDGRHRFNFLHHVFPVRAANYRFGDGFGAGRGHQGQDIFARCGRPIVAARGGRVTTRAFHSRAGYYVVISGRATGRDYVYMHLQRRGRPREGARVRTGERIGFNGQTGNASGCHLHFELWTSPGWYSGGRAIPPTKQMRRWAGWS